MTLKFKGQIYVHDDRREVFRCDTIEQASRWIGQHGLREEFRTWDYTIEGPPEAWHEQTGECGGSSICDGG